jgi:hypothetical protein
MSVDHDIASFNPIHYPWWQDPLGQGTNPKGVIPIPRCLPPIPNQVDRVLPLSTDPGSNLCVQLFPEPSLTEEHRNVYLHYIYSCFLAPAIIKRGDLSFYKISRLAVSAHSHVWERHWLEWSVSNPMKKKSRWKKSNYKQQNQQPGAPRANNEILWICVLNSYRILGVSWMKEHGRRSRSLVVMCCWFYLMMVDIVSICCVCGWDKCFG